MNLMLRDEALVTQWFGYTEYAQTNKNYREGINGLRYHEGLDIVPINRSDWGLYAPVGGSIKYVGWGEVYGKNIILYDERKGLSYRFCHLAVTGVEQGQLVNPGDMIGIIGMTGATNAKHLHLNVVPMYEYGKKDFPNNGFEGRVDPLGVLRSIGVWI